jgi:ribonucleoside-diphosphate reductase alpha chain
MAKRSPEPKPLNLAENARVVLERRYLAKDDAGNPIETPEDLFRRVAQNIALAERLYQQQATSSKRQGAKGTEGADLSPSPKSERGPGGEVWADRFYDLMASLRFLPNSPTLGNAGRPLQQLSACFVLPVEDSMESIFEAVKQTALIHQSGGGTGFAFSRLRPAGDVVRSTGGIASGPVSFMRVFDAATEAIKQGGTRRGANMAILDVHHPDIEAFIDLKGDMVTLTNFNISVAVDEAFMRAVEDDGDFDLKNPRTGEVTGTRRARAIFDRITANAWRNGDPGLVFLDRINADNPTPALGAMDATNPCGEQPLLAYESCNLGSLNLSLFVKEQQPTSNQQQGAEGATDPLSAGGEGAGGGGVDWDALADVIRTAVRFLDNVIDMNAYPVEAIDRQTKLTRKIGLGVMGWADMLFKLGIPYDSEEALTLADRVMAFIREHADAASEALAAERGPFPAWEESIYGPKGRTPEAPASAGHPLSAGGEGAGGGVVRLLRNSTRTTVAPTGTLSIIADCTGGIEPAFALAYTRQHFLDPKAPATPVRLTELNKVFEAVAREHGFYSEELVEHLAAGRSLRERPEIPEDVKRRFVTAHEIAPEWHVRMQAAFQRHTDNAVSKTINFPREASTEDVAGAYLLAYREGCKGITIYRDGSRVGQVLSHIADGEGDVASAVADGFAPSAASPNRRHLPDERRSITHKFRVGEQEGYVTVGLFADGSPGEIFVTISKEGSTIRGLMDSVAMLTSYSLQYGVSLRTLVDKFRGVHFEPAGMTSNPDIPTATSLVDYIFRWLELRFLTEEQTAQAATAPETLALRPPSHRPNRGNRRNRGPATRAQRYIPPRPALPFSEIATGLLCPDCGSEVVFAEGCLICRSCGYTRCG